jgi:hypothetical protein
MKLSIFLLTFSIFSFNSNLIGQGISCELILYDNFSLSKSFDSSEESLKNEIHLLKNSALDFENDSTNFRVAFLNMKGYHINDMKPEELINEAIKINPKVPEYYLFKAILIYNKGIWTTEGMKKACPLVEKSLELGLSNKIVDSWCFENVNLRCQ